MTHRHQPLNKGLAFCRGVIERSTTVRSRDTQYGQTMVLVAIAMVVLLGAVALAIDVGHSYSLRRQMQNAADAAALAGARAVCFGGDPVEQAKTYAVSNGAAEPATADITLAPPYYPVTVTVRTMTTTQAFLMGTVTRLLNPGDTSADNTTIGAVAAATCGRAQRACGLWPLAFHVSDWDSAECGDLIAIWNDNSDLDCTVYQCDNVPTAEGPARINRVFLTNEDRGWVLMPKPSDEYPDNGDCKGKNCGQQTTCYVEYDYDGLVDVSGGVCLPGNPGVVAVAQDTANLRSGDVVNVLLWDRGCTSSDGPTLGECSGNPYHVVGLGCVEIVAGTTVDVPELDGGLKRNIKVILARKHCPCDTYCGSTDGTVPDPDEVRAVSLVE